MAGTTNLTDETFYQAIDDWFQECTFNPATNTLTESTTGTVFTTYGLIANWNTSQVTFMSGAFSTINSDSALTKERIPFFNEDISLWDTSSVTDMKSMFYEAAAFNQPLATWNTSAVTGMRQMFFGATAFNQPLATWNTALVTDMNGMFRIATAFNQPLNSWNTSNVTYMDQMFFGATAFNQPLNSWDTANVTDMGGMFYGATAFNQDISSWNTANVTDMRSMFSGAAAFNQPLATWNTSLVTDMIAMFFEAIAFNQDISSWNTSAVTDMRSMFSGAAAFNQPLATWNTSLVTDMTAMFFEAIAFNQDISSWNTGAVENMRSMFEEATAFNQDLNNWNTDKVTNMSDMFLEATAFNQDISSWDLSLKPLIEQMFLKSAVPGTANNNAIYTTWQTKYGYTDAQLKAAGLTTPPPTPTPTPAPIPTSNICFPAGTPIQTDQGIVNIEKLNKLKHTIHGQIILHITKTVTLDPYLICFNKHSICRNSPMKTTVMTKDHKLMFEGKMVPAYRLLDYSSEIKKVKYSGEVLYNVLLHTHGLINVNGLLCETLDPENIIAKLYRHNYNETERNDIIILMNRSLKDRDLVEYTSVVNRLQRI